MRQRCGIWPARLALALATFSSLQAAEYYVSPDGRPTGNGSMASPWDLTTALAHPRAVLPGDRIWLRAGVYKGFFRSTLAGTAAAPIQVRAYANERVILDREGQDSNNRAALTVMGSHVWYWGFEVTNSDPTRVFANSFRDCVEHQHCRPPAVTVFGPGVKLINLVVHDTGDGIGLWGPAIDTEAYGNIIFYTGWQNEVRGNGHAIYVQNSFGTKRVVDNVLFSGFHSGVHFYGSSDAALRNLYMEGNTIFNTGLLARDPNGWGILIGGGVPAENVTLTDNYIYNPEWFLRSNNLSPSYGKGTNGVLLNNNYSAGYVALASDIAPLGLRSSANVFAGSVNPSILPQIQAEPTNVVVPFQSMTGKPNRVFIRRNRYEPNKANVTIFNWSRTPDVEIDLSTFLKQGDSFEIVDIQNYFGQPVRTGTFDGKPVSIPMVSGSGKPIGSVPGERFRTTAEFGVFQVRIRAAAEPPPSKLRIAGAALNFSYREGTASPPLQTLFVFPAGADAVQWEAQSDAAWLRLERPPVDGGGRLIVSAAPAGLTPGTYQTHVRLVPEGGPVQVVPVTLWVTGSEELPVIDVVSNAASRFPAVAPGGLISIQGVNLSTERLTAAQGEPLQTELGGTRVSIAGVRAYLRSVTPEQILAVAPSPADGAAGVDNVEVIVETMRGAASARVDMLPVSIGLFEFSAPPGHIAASHADGRIVANLPGDLAAVAAPARAGDNIALYLTGFQNAPYMGGAPVVSALPADSHVEVLFGGRPATVTFAGLTQPGAGQVNVIVPDISSGLQPVVLRYRGGESQASAYLPVAQ